MLQARSSSNYARSAAIAIAGLLLFTTSLFAQTATLQWNANAESNLAGYVVEYGTQSGNPSTSLDVGNVTQRQITGLQAGMTYYLRVSAYNTSGLRSVPSSEVSHTVPAIPAPITLSLLAPASGPTSGGTVVTLTGSGFVSGASVSVGGVAATGVTFLSASQLRATTPAGTAGAKSVQVTNPSGQSVTLANGFTYQAPQPTPTLTSVSPTSGPTAGGTVITLTGTNFVSGASVSVGGVGATGVTFVSASQLSATTPAGTPGAKSVRVTNPSGQSVTLSSAFTYQTAAPAPTLTSILPSSGPTSGGTPMTLTGTNFVSGASVSIGGVAATDVTFVSSSQVRATTPATSAGVKTVTLTNPDGQSASLASAFTVFTSTGSPTFTSISPSSGTSAGGTLVTVRGTSFMSGTGLAVYIGMSQLTSLQFISSTELRGRTPAGSAGSTFIGILNPNGKYVYVQNAFTYTTTSSATAATLTEAASSPDEDVADAARAGEADDDGDGLPTEWEQRFGLAADSAEGDNGAAGDPDGDGTPNADEYRKRTHPRGLFRRYFAEGAQTGGVDTRIAVANPATAPAAVILSFFDESGAVTRVPASVPARTRVTIETRAIATLAGSSFSTEIESDQPVAADRLMVLGPGASGSNVETAVERPSMRWYLAEGTTRQPVSLTYLVQNPNDSRADVQVRYLLPDGTPPVTKAYTVEAHGRLVIEVNREDAALASTDVAAEVVSLNNTPIVVERSMTIASTDGGATGHISAGAPAASANWFLEGSTADGVMMLLVVNPSSDDASIRVTYQLANGERVVKTHRVGAGRRSTIVVGDEDPRLAGAAMGIYVESTNGVPIVAERTTWWGSRTAVDDGYNSAGVTEAGARWLVAEAEQGGPRAASTSVVVSNIGAAAAPIAVTLLFEGGAEQSATFEVGGGRQLTLPIATAFPAAQGRRFSVLVEGIDPATAGGLIVVRTLFWRAASGRVTGADALGARLP